MSDIYRRSACTISERMVSSRLITINNCIDIFIYTEVTIANWLTGSFAGMVVTGYKLCNQLVELKY